jgi:hypothetical protein
MASSLRSAGRPVDGKAILMTPEADVRWRQRFANYCRALELLEGFFEPSELNEREEQGLIKAFEYPFELGWNTLREAFRQLRTSLEQRQP